MTDAPWRWQHGAQYGLLGLPLAFVTLPLYVLLPHYYANTWGMPLAVVGAVLLAARLLDAVTDPLLGWLNDRWFAQSPRTVLAWSALSAVVLALGLTCVFLPAVQGVQALQAWLLVSLIVTSIAYSQLSISHQAWGARWGGHEVFRARIVAWREGAALLGVLVASALPALAGIPAMLATFVLALAAGWWAWTRAPRPPSAPATVAAASSAPAAPSARAAMLVPWRNGAFRRLLAVLMLNGIASAIPATLLLFFIHDVLQAPPAQEPLFLLVYFACAALSIPAWLQLVARCGVARTWLCGMVLAIVTFAGAATLGADDSAAFFVVCALCGCAVGTDLVLPSAMLAGVIAQQGDAAQHEGAYFGWWNCATKLNLALAAGVALPVVQWLGYAPGVRTEAGLHTLSLAYAVLPCALKLLAAGVLYRSVRELLPVAAGR